MNRHYFGSFDPAQLKTPSRYASHSQGYRRAAIIDHTTAPSSVHMGVNIVEIAPGGYLNPIEQASEKGFFVLEGGVIATIEDKSYEMVKNSYGVVPLGIEHAWYNPGESSVRILEMMCPQPKPADASFQDRLISGKSAPQAANANPSDNPKLGFFDDAQLEQKQDLSGIGASSGVTMIPFTGVETEALHHRMFLLRYMPGANIRLHDHMFEEAYLILSGEVEATLDGQVYTAKAGGVIWTGVGSVHSFRNASDEPVIWLETQAPLPPGGNVFCFQDDWEARSQNP